MVFTRTISYHIIMHLYVINHIIIITIIIVYGSLLQL